MPNFNDAPLQEANYFDVALPDQGEPQPNGHDRNSFVSWDAVKAATRGRELEIARALAGVECNERDHTRCPLPAHPDNHPSFRAMPCDDGTIRFICSANCPVFHRPSDIFDLVSALKGGDAKNEIATYLHI